MRKAILAGALGLMTAGGLLVAQNASAHYGYNETSCNGAALVNVPTTTVQPIPELKVETGGKIHGPDLGSHQVVCGDEFRSNQINDVDAGFDGGSINASVEGANGPTRVCLPNGTSVATGLPGAYLIVNGDNANTVASSSGYFGASSYETGGANQGCPPPLQNPPANGGGTNSGGSLGIDGVIAAPVPFAACGFSSGPSYGNTPRDGCYLP